MKNQYLLIAEDITYKNNKLSCINIFDQFIAHSIPSEIVFDMALICGPNWERGIYDININVDINNNQTEIGNIKIEIPHENFVYNAMAHNLKLSIEESIDKLKFIVYKDNEMILQRNYLINILSS